VEVRTYGYRLTCSDVKNVPFGVWTASVRLCFGGGQPGLTEIGINIDEHSGPTSAQWPTYSKIMKVLRAKYGPPTSDNSKTSANPKGVWELPNTKIVCYQFDFRQTGHLRPFGRTFELSVDYNWRDPAPPRSPWRTPNGSDRSTPDGLSAK